MTCGIRAACNEYVIASAEEDCRTCICSELDANNDRGEENDAITAKRSRCVADGRRHASNIADDDEKSIWIGKTRRPGIWRQGRMSGIELL